MRQSIAPGRMSMAGQRSTGLSNRFSTQPVDFKRYAINAPGTAQRQSMAASRFPQANRATTQQVKVEQANELIQFFKDHNALFQFPIKEVRDGPSRNNFRAWFEFIVKMLNHNYEVPDTNNSINEEVPAVMHCLNYHPPIKSSTMAGLNSPHQWPTFLALLDWLRKLTIINSEDNTSGTEVQDYTIKYSFDCYKQQHCNGSTDFTEILAAIRELVVCSNSYDDLNEEIRQAQEANRDFESKLELETAAIAQVEKEIFDYKQEIESLSNSENELKYALNGMESKIVDADDEIRMMEEKLRGLRAENEMLNKQVTAQPMSAYEAQDLLQKRNNLRDEHKEKKIRHDKLYANQAEANKRLTKLATEKTEIYRTFCSELFQPARLFDTEANYRNFEIALFGKSGGVDSLRASQLGSEVTEMFRMLMNVIRANIQRRLNEFNKERLDSQVKQIENDNRMRNQQIQQIEQRNKLELESREMKFREATNQLKQAESEYEMASKQVESLVKQNDAMCSRVDTQSAIMKQVEAKISNIDMEESDMLNQFADYMVEASTRFESCSKLNGELLNQKQMLLEASLNIVDHAKQILKKTRTIPLPDFKSKENIMPSLDDLKI